MKAGVLLGRTAPRALAILVSVVVLGLVSRVFAGQATPPSSSQPPPVPTGVIGGQVVDAVSGLGVPGALVRLGRPLSLIGPTGLSEPTLTAYTFGMRYIRADQTGRFTVPHLDAGTYTLVVMTSGYVISAYGQLRPNAPIREIVLADKQEITGLVIPSWKAGVITGTVLDEAGEPAVDVQVNATRLTFVAGRMVTQGGSSTRTDDRGVYRIASLDPADYIVSVPVAAVTAPTPVSPQAAGAQATPGMPLAGGFTLVGAQRSRGVTLPSGASGAATYRTIFYPGATLADQATPITVRAADERSGIDFRLAPERAFRVVGNVTLVDGVEGALALSLVPAGGRGVPDAPGFETAATTTSPDGRFLFADVPEGDYELRLLKVAQPPRDVGVATNVQTGSQTGTFITVSPTTPQAPVTSATFWATVRVSVHDRDLDGVVVTPSHGARVRGRVAFDGATPPPAAGQARGPQVTVQLIAADGRALGNFTPANVSADMQFTTMQYPPGKYFMSAFPQVGWSLKSIMVNGVDALRTPFVLTGADLADVVVTFSDRPTELTGSVRVGGASVTPDAVVVIFPLDYRSWIDQGMAPRLTRTTAIGRDGSYRLADLLPGDYLVVAYPADAPGDPRDPAFVNVLAGWATPTTIALGEKKAVALTMVKLP